MDPTKATSLITIAQYRDILRKKRKQHLPRERTHKNGPPPFLSCGIFIPGNVPSSKNSKRIAGPIKKRILINSELVMEYKGAVVPFFIDNASSVRQMITGKSFPLIIRFTFVRDSKRRFDFPNAVQILLDLMQEYMWIPDDSMDYVLPIPPLPPSPGYYIDKDHCGVSIEIL
jgi:hypothetical protein